jgi:hypothetical protein
VNRLLASPVRVGLGLLAVTSLTLIAGCGDDDDSADAAAATATAQTSDEAAPGSYEIVTDAAVAQGYSDMLATMTQLTADPSTADDKALEGVHETWQSFEGTVKQNDSDAYLASEEALDSFLEAGADKDAAAMAAATAKMSETAATYVAAHPG